MKASQLDLSNDFPHFPELIDYEIPLDLLDARVVVVLQQIRYSLDQPIYPSPLKRAWARTDKKSSNSQHYAVNRLSKAGDIFPERGYLMNCWLAAQQQKDIKGLGLYSDTNGPDGKNWPMLHYDLRNSGRRIFWVRENKKYYTLGADDFNFWRVINDLIKRIM